MADSHPAETAPAPRKASRLDGLEQGARIFATTMVPIIIAIGGWAIQTTIEKDRENAAKIQQNLQSAIDKEKISLEYVKIAKDILTSTEKDMPRELTTWSWRMLDGVSPIKFDKDDLNRLIERKERIPTPTVPSVSLNFSSLAPEYDQMFNTMTLTLSPAQLDSVVDRIAARKADYAAVESQTGVPWFVIGIGHYLQNDQDFGVHLHNGDPLDARTVRVPAGRPTTGQPPFSWQDSAVDAVRMLYVIKIDDWTVARVLYELERHNGFGYRRRQVNSPWLWNCTSHYIKGRFMNDHVFDPEAVAPPRCGGAGLLKRMMDRQLVALR
jgi:lysozyme family protein